MLEKAALFFILFLPVQMALNPLPGIDLAASRVLAIALFLFWLGRSLKRKSLFIPAHFQTWLVISFLLWAGLSVFQAENPTWAWRKLIFWLSFFPLYFVFASLLQHENFLHRSVKFIVLGGIVAAASGLVQFALQFIFGLDQALRIWEKIIPFFLGSAFGSSVLEHSSWLVNVGGNNVFRAVGFFPDPHMLSLFLGLVLPWAGFLAHASSLSRAKSFYFWTAGTFLILTADLLTFSRGAYLGMAAGASLAILLLLRNRFSKRIWALPLFFLLLVSIVPDSVSDRFLSSFDLQEGSNRERLLNWQEASRIIRERPWLGTGIGNYSLAVEASADYRDPIYAHNLFLDVAAETGIPNALILLGLIGSATYRFWVLSKQERLFLAGTLSLIIFSTHSLFENGLFSVHVLPVLIIILALSAAPKK